MAKTATTHKQIEATPLEEVADGRLAIQGFLELCTLRKLIDKGIAPPTSVLQSFIASARELRRTEASDRLWRLALVDSLECQRGPYQGSSAVAAVRNLIVSLHNRLLKSKAISENGIVSERLCVVDIYLFDLGNPSDRATVLAAATEEVAQLAEQVDAAAPAPSKAVAFEFKARSKHIAMLRALVQLKATSAASAVKLSQVAHCLAGSPKGRVEASGGLRSTKKELKDQRLVETVIGPNGGIWILESGVTLLASCALVTPGRH